MLKGTLEDFDLADVFRLLAASEHTGRLDVERPAGSGQVLFSTGQVVYAETSLSPSLLGQKLVVAGVITDPQLRSALDTRATSGKRLGEVLVETGLVAVEELDAALGEQIQDAVYELLEWETGEFVWTGSESVETPRSGEFLVDELLEAASRRAEELSTIKTKIPSLESVPVMAAQPPEGAEEVRLSPREWRAIVLVDGQRSVAEIAAAIGGDELEALRVLFGLVSNGLVEIPASSPEADIAEALVEVEPPPPEEPEPTDPTEEAPKKEDWFADPPEVVEPMTTGAAEDPPAAKEVPTELDLDTVEVKVEDVVADSKESGEPKETESPDDDMAFPVVDKAAAARELSGLSADDRPARNRPSASGDDDDDSAKGLFPRLRSK